MLGFQSMNLQNGYLSEWVTQGGKGMMAGRWRGPGMLGKLDASGIRHFSFQRLLNSGNHRKPSETRKLGHFETYVRFPGNLPWQQATETMETYGNYGNLRNLKTMVAVAMQQLKTKYRTQQLYTRVNVV